ncbi:tetratricopeptide repeat protein [Pedobacter xixiisoli]|uniref:Tetratricopeptide repeat-containing protein n=1 Tax=Pedobacter xixiisoli TaxID=1476464 RepID=A0A285ZYN4_9SPHI|nr:tetratricopeptide repeat protein [Pedobacter xixiisoli]SOD14761.1 Tetratricopeptide repeat-containing protein [Pedobacter xixiisoli]
MIEDNRLAKIDILFQQQRFAEAERILKELLSQDAGNIYCLSLLAEANLQQDKLEEAQKIIENAIGLSPDNPYLFYIKARIAIQQDNYKAAEQHILQAIELDAYDADYFALLANIKLAGKHYEEALEHAENALQIDAENLLALNIRSTALLKLNKVEESFNTIEGALREDPNNAFTHANYGWGLLESGNHKKALEHFREALKNDPGFSYAQAGMREALKAGNPIYRMFLKYAFWMGNLTSKYQWVVILGFYFGIRGLRALAEANETLEPYLVPLIILLSLVAFSTWVITPVSNLFLRFNRYGQLLLDKNETMSSNFVAASFFTFLIGTLCYFTLAKEEFLTVAVFGFTMMVPLSVVFSPTKPKLFLPGYTVLMTLFGLIAIGLAFSTGEVFNGASLLYVFSFVAFQWVANFFTIKEGNKYS